MQSRTQRAFEVRNKIVQELRSLDADIEARSDKSETAEEAAKRETLEGELRKASDAMEAAMAADAEDQRFHDAFAAAGFTPEPSEQRDTPAAAELRALEAFITGEARDVDFMPESRSIGKGAAEGGAGVPDSLYGQIIKAIREFSTVVAAGATVLNTSNGNEISVPRRNAYPVAALVAEKGTYGKSNGTLEEALVLRAYKYGLISQASYELLTDSAFNMAAEVAELGGEAIGLGVGAAFMNGTGTNQPEGLASKAADNTFAATTAITADELFDVEHSIKRPYRQNAAFILNDATIKLIRKLKDTDGNYLWRPGITVGAPDTILGYPVFDDSEMATPVAAAKSVIFGDIRKAFMVRFAGGVNVARSDEYAWDTDLVSWKWTTRVDSGIVLPEAYTVWNQAAV